jgi:predicted nucleic acid-binding protein
MISILGFRVRSILNSMAEPRRAGIDRAAAYRYKAVKQLGANDVLIALAAKRLGATLATGDWPQARFYMSLAGRKPLYIPFRQL